MNLNKRKTGFYWIKIQNIGWTIGLYSAIDNLWSIMTSKIEYYDEHLLEIDNNPIIKTKK